ncbi:MAG: NAD(+)/NADH kinase [Sphaerochaetaceae bacterium]|nr:NAD(+)/NADH kinase [Sphaerochaetaceae bacterium]
MKLFICPNGFTKKQTEQARNCVSILETQNECALSISDSTYLFGNSSFAKFTPKESDLIVSIGGDGSLLRAAQTAITANKPLVGINSGTVGYLCPIDLHDVNHFNKLLGNLLLSERTLIEVEYNHKTLYALNDIVIAKNNFGETINLSISTGNDNSVTLRGDGLIISTPTGSTAYNLSAGGPVIDYKLPAFVLTPICPQKSFLHPVVINDNHQINVKVQNNKANLHCDGFKIGDINKDITIKKSNRKVCLYSQNTVNKDIITFS